MIILAAPPAAAITYVKELSGLEPSVYGGGGSDSSALLLDSPLLSAGSAALVSSSTLVVPATVASAGDTGLKAGGGSLRGSVIDALRRSGDDCGGK